MKVILRFGISALVKEHPDSIHPEIEVRNIADDPRSLLYCDGKTIPARALDTHFLTESKSVFGKFKNCTYEAFTRADKGTFSELEKQFEIPAHIALKKASKAKKCDEQAPCTVKEGVLRFDGRRIKSVKYSHLRSVQYPLSHLIASLVKSGKITSEVYSELPRNTIARLGFLQERGLCLMNKKSVEKVSKAYQQALVWYDKSQKAFYDKGEQIVRVDIGKLKKVTKEIKDVSKEIKKSYSSLEGKDDE